MKNKVFLIIVASLLGAAAVFGLVFRFSYTNITAEENYLDKLQVGEIPEGICLVDCELLHQSLPEAPLILRVTPVAELEQHFGRSIHKVVVRQTFVSEDVSVGDEIYITANGWRAIIRKDGWSTERNFVNVMREGSDYLVFLRDYDKIRWDDCTVYYLDENRVIAPVFCYDDIPNIVIPKSGSDTYVPYSEVRDNEFFAASQAGLDAWLSLKQEMLAAYPRQ